MHLFAWLKAGSQEGCGESTSGSIPILGDTPARVDPIRGSELRGDSGAIHPAVSKGHIKSADGAAQRGKDTPARRIRMSADNPPPNVSVSRYSDSPPRKKAQLLERY